MIYHSLPSSHGQIFGKRPVDRSPKKNGIIAVGVAGYQSADFVQTRHAGGICDLLGIDALRRLEVRVQMLRRRIPQTDRTCESLAVRAAYFIKLALIPILLVIPRLEIALQV